MNKIWLVLKNEFISVVFRRSFILTLILLPLTSFIILLVVSGLQKSTGTNAETLLSNLFVPDTTQSLEGFVDLSDMMNTIPDNYKDLLVQYETEDDARKAVQTGEISAFYLINKDFLETGDIFYYRTDFNPLGGSMNSSAIDALMTFNLTKGDLDLTYRVQNPINVKEENLSSTPQREIDNPLTFILPYVVTFLFYIVILTSSSLMLNSITSEKQNRVLEILMTSISPRQMLTGKIIALGLVGLMQTVIWLGAGLLMLRYSTQNFALGAAFQLPVSVLLWGILFFILGYSVYASLMSGLGALVPNLREASQLTIIVIMPLIIPIMFISVLIQAPDSPLSLFLSLFPLTSPVTMMTRLSATTVPIWQILIAVALLAGTALLLVRTSARLFRAQNLLSGKSITAAGFIRALIGR